MKNKELFIDTLVLIQVPIVDSNFDLKRRIDDHLEELEGDVVTFLSKEFYGQYYNFSIDLQERIANLRERIINLESKLWNAHDFLFSPEWSEIRYLMYQILWGLEKKSKMFNHD